MKQFISTLIGLTALCTTLATAAPLKPFTAIYSVKYRHIPAGTVTRTLSYPAKNHYLFSSTTSSSLLFIHLNIFEQSEGLWTLSGPRPNMYQYQYRLFHREHNELTTFDWPRHFATTQKDERHYGVDLKPNTQDQLSMVLALRDHLLHHIGPVTFSLTNRAELKTYTFVKKHYETLSTPIGKIKTIKMRHSNQTKKDIYDIWLAPKYQYLPIKIIRIEDGEIVAQENLYQLRLK